MLPDGFAASLVSSNFLCRAPLINAGSAGIAFPDEVPDVCGCRLDVVPEHGYGLALRSDDGLQLLEPALDLGIVVDNLSGSLLTRSPLALASVTM